MRYFSNLIVKMSVIINLKMQKFLEINFMYPRNNRAGKNKSSYLYYQCTWETYGTSGSLTITSKLISAIPSVCVLFRNFATQTFRPRFRRFE